MAKRRKYDGNRNENRSEDVIMTTLDYKDPQELDDRDSTNTEPDPVAEIAETIESTVENSETNCIDASADTKDELEVITQDISGRMNSHIVEDISSATDIRPIELKPGMYVKIKPGVTQSKNRFRLDRYSNIYDMVFGIDRVLEDRVIIESIKSVAYLVFSMNAEDLIVIEDDDNLIF